ncbi:MAG: hypothetical protein ACREFE_17345 [Limisphaerales bacterium]
MKTNLIFTFIMLAFCHALANDWKTNEWGEITNNVQMSINLKNNEREIKIGEPILLAGHIRNLSTNETFLGYRPSAGAPDLTFVVINPFGNDVSPKFPKDNVSISGAMVSVSPGQTKSFKFDLNVLFKLWYLQKFDKVGTYTIIARQKGYSGTNQTAFTVTSNPLYVTVVADK